MPAKRCPDCGQEKPLSEFGNNRTTKDGLQVYCRSCCARRGAEIYRRKRERAGKTVRKNISVPEGHKHCRRCDQVKPFSEWHRNARQSDGLASYCKECRKHLGRLGHLKRTFGLTLEEVASLIDSQGGMCAICDGPPQHIDHDHATGRIRGVLCGLCNMGLGQFGDDPMRLARACSYLRRHGLRSVIQVDEYMPPERVVFEVTYRHLSA